MNDQKLLTRIKLIHGQLIGALTVMHLAEVVILVYDHDRYISAVRFWNGQGGTFADIDNGTTVKRISIASYNGWIIQRHRLSKMKEFINFAFSQFQRFIEIYGCLGTHKIVDVYNNGFSCAYRQAKQTGRAHYHRRQKATSTFLTITNPRFHF